MAYRISVDVPDWAAERHIRIMAGTELLAMIPHGTGQLWQKKDRCVNCGWCCENLLPEPCPELKRGADGTTSCAIMKNRPWRCTWPDPHLTKAKGAENCKISYEVIDL